MGLVPCSLLSIWSGTEWEGVTENTSSPVKVVCEQAAFGNHCLVTLSHLAPTLLKPAEAVPNRAAAVFAPLCHHGALILRSSTERNCFASTEQGQATWE